MARKWAISDEPPLKVRLVRERESDREAGQLVERPIRVRAVGRRIVKVLVTLWVLSIGAWLQACHHGVDAIAGADGLHDAIDGQGDQFNVF